MTQLPPRSSTPQEPLARSRRDFLFRCGTGFGALPLVALLNETHAGDAASSRTQSRRRPWRRRRRCSCRATERDFPLHGWRAKPARYVRSKAAGQRTGRSAVAREHQATVHADGGLEQRLARQPRTSFARPDRVAFRSRTGCLTSRPGRRADRHSLVLGRRAESRRLGLPDEHRLDSGRPAEPG